MNWLTDFIRPRIRSLVDSKEVPDNLWDKCPSCDGMLFHRELQKNLRVCNHCGHHLRITVKERLAFLFDDGKYERFELPTVPYDPLKFRDRKKYSDRLAESRKKTGLKEALTIAKGKIRGQGAVIAAFNFSFMGGSMGTGVGEGIVKAAEEAIKANCAFIVVPSSGGARMQEGMLSLMQMPRTIIAVNRVKDAGLPYIVLLSDPTTGGVSASFAMVGDIHIAEPGAMIGFAGRRVIEETVREKLPEDFQTAEYLMKKGMVDMVVPREEQADTIANIISILMKKPALPKKSKNGKQGADISSDKKSGAKSKTSSSKGTKAKKSDKGVEKAKKKAKKAVSQAKNAAKAAKAYKKPSSEVVDTQATVKKAKV